MVVYRSATEEPMSYPFDANTVLATLAGKGYDIERVAGISLGGCCDAFGTDRTGAMRRSGHAHTDVRSEWRGWICIKSGKPEKIVTASGRASTLLIHEVAHIVTWAGHTVRWRKAVADLGAPGEAKRYEASAKARKARPPATWYWHDRVTGEQMTGTYRQMMEATK
jgi:hypothetical protein